MQIADSVVVITGASSGIARATALEAARRGARVVLASRQENALREVAEECERMGGKALVAVADVSDEPQVQQLARRAIETFGRIDVWVNAAAVTLMSRFDEAPGDQFRQVIETNFFGYVYGARAVLPHYNERGGGILINVSSVVGKVATPYASAYVASKFAITGLTESLRMEYRDQPDIHICTVFPATTDTPFFQHAANRTGRAVQAMPPVYDPEQAACRIVDCMERPQREVSLGNTRRMVTLRTLAPALAEGIAAKKVDRQHFQDKPAEHTTGNMFQSMPDACGIHGGWMNENGQAKTGVALAAAAIAAIGAAAVLLTSRPRRRTRWVRATDWVMRRRRNSNRALRGIIDSVTN